MYASLTNNGFKLSGCLDSHRVFSVLLVGTYQKSLKTTLFETIMFYSEVSEVIGIFQ